jgi:transcriptional repressor NrdR
METIEGIVGRIEEQMDEMGWLEVPSAWIGERVMAELQQVDEVAYVRFASVYRQFGDVTQFMNELKGLSPEEPPRPKKKKGKK